MRALFLLSKRQPPSSRIRILDCLDHFRAAGLSCTAAPIPSSPLGRGALLREAAHHDAVVIQKKTSFRGFELALLRRVNPRIVFDFDDAVMFHELEHHKPLTGKHFRKFVRTVSHCAAVVAGNSFLARFARPNCPRVHVLPTPIDTARYTLAEPVEDAAAVTVGWIGVSRNLVYLEALAPVLQRLAREFAQLRLKIISNAFVPIDGVQLVEQPWSLDGEIAALQSLDIGIMPLDDGLWAQGKCGFKILQYMGVGRPAVASPVGINSDIIVPGETGFLAADLGQWHDALARLIADPALRRRQGLAGRRRVEAQFALAVYVRRYLAVLREVAALPGSSAAP
jgi:glycosyltransferase involved in cell wall biosynthesis